MSKIDLKIKESEVNIMYSITKVGDRTNSGSIREFVADKLEDISKLPHVKIQGVQQGDDTVSNDCVMAGSSCFCIENSSVYMLGNDDVWHEI